MKLSVVSPVLGVLAKTLWNSICFVCASLFTVVGPWWLIYGHKVLVWACVGVQRKWVSHLLEQSICGREELGINLENQNGPGFRVLSDRLRSGHNGFSKYECPDEMLSWTKEGGQKKGRKSKWKVWNEKTVLKEESMDQGIPTVFRGVSQAF